MSVLQTNATGRDKGMWNFNRLCFAHLAEQGGITPQREKWKALAISDQILGNWHRFAIPPLLSIGRNQPVKQNFWEPFSSPVVFLLRTIGQLLFYGITCHKWSGLLCEFSAVRRGLDCRDGASLNQTRFCCSFRWNSVGYESFKKAMEKCRQNWIPIIVIFGTTLFAYVTTTTAS